MKIVSIVLLSVFSLIFIGGILFASIKRVDKSKYDVVTGSSISYSIFGWIFTISGIALLISGVILVFVLEPEKTGVGLSISGFVLGLMGFLLVYIITVQFEGIKGTTVYIRRVFKTKQFDVNEISSIDFYGIGFIAYGRKGNRLFSVDAKTKNCGALLEEISKKATKPISSNLGSFVNEPVLDSNDDLSFEKIGKDYRKNYLKHRNGFILSFLVCPVFIFVTIITLFVIFVDVMIGKKILLIAVLATMMIIILFIVLRRFLKNLDNELNLSDKSLGIKHKYSNKSVVGYHKVKGVRISMSLATMSIVGVISLPLLLVAYLHMPYKEVELKKVNGVVDYFNYVGVEHSYYELGLVGDPVEYRIDEEKLANVDNLSNRITSGKEVEIQIASYNEPQEISGTGFKREKYTWFYTIVTTDDDVYSYSTYIEENSKEHKKAKIAGYTLLGISLVYLTSALVVYTTYARKKDGEYIKL